MTLDHFSAHEFAHPKTVGGFAFGLAPAPVAVQLRVLADRIETGQVIVSNVVVRSHAKQDEFVDTTLVFRLNEKSALPRQRATAEAVDG